MIEFEIVGARKVELKLEELPKRFHEALLARIVALTRQLEARVLGLVPRRTGRLASEISSTVIDQPERIRGRVFVRGATSNDFAKAGALEYGAHRTIEVRRRESLSGRLSRRESAASDRVYARHQNLAARLFMRGALDPMKAEILQELQEALAEAEREGG